jgi:hypothetical protein
MTIRIRRVDELESQAIYERFGWRIRLCLFGWVIGIDLKGGK